MVKNHPKDLSLEVEKLTGIWRAVVEDNEDPLKSGRVRVRIHGIHSPKIIKTEIDGIPVNELPWAEPAFPINLGSVSGIGQWSVPVQGSHVFVFFENNNLNQIRYFASVPGIPESQEQYSNSNISTTKDIGFKDPDGKYPLKSRLGESDFHRLSRGITTDTEIESRNNNRDFGVAIAGGGTWSEPQSSYNAKYPNNHVISTQGGITIELDSTPNSKRIHIYHPSNSFIEIDNDGNIIVKNNKEKYEIVANGKNIYIKQQRNITIGSDSNKKIGTDENIEVGGDKTEEITGSMNQTIGVDKAENIIGSKEENIGSNKTSIIGGNKTETITGNKEVTAAALNINVTGNCNVTSSGNVNLSATSIDINGLVNIAIQDALKKLLTEDAATLFNSHVHEENDGGFTNPPQQQMNSSHMTANVEAS